MMILMPQLGETVADGEVTVWYLTEGESVVADQPLLEISTDKAVTEVPSPISGVLRRILVEAGKTVAVGTALAEIVPANAELPKAAQSPELQGIDEPAAPTAKDSPRPWRSMGPKRDRNGRVLSPAVRRLLAENRIAPEVIAASGRAGRLRRRDVEDHLRGKTQTTEAGAGSLVPFSHLRKRIAENMLASKSRSPHVLQAIEVDFQAVLTARRQVEDAWRRHHAFAPTFLPFVAHAVCRALAQYPVVNASIVGEALRLHADVNLAIAVDLEFSGVVAPVVRGAQSCSILELGQRIDELIRRARAGKLMADDLRGGTYTISNSGSFGTLLTAPIINPPQVAILSLDGIRKRPVVVESAAGDAIAIRPVGILAQSFDHRAFDGAYSAAFLRCLKELIETSDWAELAMT